MSILDEIYYGNICPSDRRIVRGSEYHTLSKQLVQQEELLLKSLTAEEIALYERVFELRFQMEDIASRENFEEGFRLGAQIVLAVYSNSN